MIDHITRRFFFLLDPTLPSVASDQQHSGFLPAKPMHSLHLFHTFLSSCFTSFRCDRFIRLIVAQWEFAHDLARAARVSNLLVALCADKTRMTTTPENHI